MYMNVFKVYEFDGRNLSHSGNDVVLEAANSHLGGVRSFDKCGSTKKSINPVTNTFLDDISRNYGPVNIISIDTDLNVTIYETGVLVYNDVLLDGSDFNKFCNKVFSKTYDKAFASLKKGCGGND